MSANIGKSEDRSSSTSESFSRTFVDPQQVGFLERLRSGAEGATDDVLAQILASGLPQQQDVAGQARSALAQILSGGTAPDPLSQRLAAFRPGFVDQQVDALSSDLARFEGRQLADVDSQFAGGGTLGGGRNQVERALVREAATDAFTRGSAEIRGRGEQLALEAALGEGREAALSGDQLFRALTQAPAVANLGLEGQMAALAPYSALAQILGVPTLLSESEGMTTSSSRARSFEIGAGQGS